MVVRLVGRSRARARARARARHRFTDASRGYLVGTWYAGICLRSGTIHCDGSPATEPALW